jgi:hypothetical protein
MDLMKKPLANNMVRAGSLDKLEAKLVSSSCYLVLNNFVRTFLIVFYFPHVTKT